MDTFARGRCPKFTVTIKDYDQTSLIDPDSQSITITDSKGVVVLTETNPSYSSLGMYWFNYTIPSDANRGTWVLDWAVVKDGTPSGATYSFRVK